MAFGTTDKRIGRAVYPLIRFLSGAVHPVTRWEAWTGFRNRSRLGRRRRRAPKAWLARKTRMGNPAVTLPERR
jgi:hypothetical protein